jgi:hypothetical protein
VITLLIGGALGALAGYVAERLPIPPVIQSIGAAIGGGILASVACGIAWLLRPPPDASVMAIGFGIFEFGVASLILGALAGALHMALGRASSSGISVLATHRGVITGVVGGVYAAIAFLGELGPLHGVR